MTIVTQYGVRITDRVTIDADPAQGGYIVKFDGDIIGRAHSGPHGVRLARDWLRQRQLDREAAERAEAAAEAERVKDEENCFLRDVAQTIGLTFEDVERLLDIAARRAKEA